MKKIVSMVLTIALAMSFVACSSTEYKDTNGADDFSLQTITDEEIVNLSTGASGLSYSEESLEDVLLSSEYSSKNFNGVERIYLTNFLIPSDVMIYIGHMDVQEGNFRLVLVNNDEIIYEFPLDTFNETFTFENLIGDFSIMVAGESAKFSFHINVY